MGAIQEIIKNRQKSETKKKYDILRSKALDLVEKGQLSIKDFEIFLNVLKMLRF